MSPRKSPDILDIFVAKIPTSLYCTTDNILDLYSDHSSVLLTLNDYPSTHETPPNLFNSSTDRFKFHDLVNQGIKLNVKLKTNDDIDSAVNSITNLIQSAAWSSKSVVNTNTFSKNKFSLPSHIRMLIAEKRRDRALYQRTHLPSHKQKYNSLANSLKKILAKNKSLSIANHLSNLSANDGSLWIKTKQILQHNPTIPPIRKTDGSFATSDLEKAELFKNHLYEIFQPHPDIIVAENVNTVQTFLNSPLPHTLPEKHFTPNDVKYTIQKYQLKKSPGFDFITAEVARCLPKCAIILLTHIFNAILRLSYFPLL